MMMGDNFNNNIYGGMPENIDQKSDLFSNYPHIQNAEGNVCRDFLRNACNRGVNCRYQHPEDPELRGLPMDVSNREMTFCHDYQNRGCKRAGCKFLHCTREEVEEYKRTGLMPRTVQASLQRVPPICMDFKNGNCSRGPRCKYRHMNEIDNQTNYDRLVNSIMFSKKRKFMEDIFDDDGRGEDSMKSNDFNKLKEENVQLKKRIEDLERQLSVLVASNELLLEQNARYRSCKLITVPPIVAVSQITPTVPPAPTIGASRPHPTLTQQTPHGITTTATLSLGGNQREFVLPPPTQPLVQPSLHSQVATVDQNSMTMAPMALSLTPCTNLSNVALSQQKTMTAAPALSLSMPLPSHSAHIQNSNLVSYPLTSNQQSRVK